MIRKVIAILPRLHHVEFKYCNIVYNPLPQNNAKTLSSKQTDLTNKNSLTNSIPTFTSLSFTWTEFSHKSNILSLYPQVTNLELGSNRNKYPMVNELMAKSITKSCPNLTHLSIALPQVSEATLCDMVAHYGNQLQQLSIRCDTSSLLNTIASCSTNLTHLTLRISPSADNEKISDCMLSVIQECKSLKELEVWSSYLEHDVPLEIWESIIAEEMPHDIIQRAKAVLSNTLICSKSSPTNNADQPGSAFGLSSRVWFDVDVFEDVLQQRYLHDLLNGNKQHSNIPENLVIGHSVLQAMRLNESSA
jgi:hypothetical protein